MECGEEGVVKILSCDKDLLELVSDKASEKCKAVQGSARRVGKEAEESSATTENKFPKMGGTRTQKRRPSPREGESAREAQEALGQRESTPHLICLPTFF